MTGKPNYWGKLWDRLKKDSGYTKVTNDPEYLFMQAVGHSVASSIGKLYSSISNAQRRARQQEAFNEALSDMETTEELLERVKKITDVKYPPMKKFLTTIFEKFHEHALTAKDPIYHIDFYEPFLHLIASLYKPELITPPAAPTDRQSISRSM